MFSTKNRVGGSLLLVIIVVGLILVPHGMNQPVNAQVADAGLTVTPHTVTVGTCTRSGTYTQKFVFNPSARSSYTTHWSPGLPELALGYQITVDGYGYVQASINYNVGSDTGSYTWPALKVGRWGHRGALSLWTAYATRVTAYTAEPSLSFARIDNHAYGTYNWSSSGTVTLQAKYCKRTGPYWCEWENLGSPGSESFSGSGSWTLAKTFVCPNCSQDVPYTDYHKEYCYRVTYQRNDGRAYVRGCGNSYWTCDSTDVAKHAPKSCSKTGCDGKYRTCGGGGHLCRPSNGGGTTDSNTVSSGGGTVSSGGITYIACPAGSSCRQGGRYAQGQASHVRGIGSWGCGSHSSYYSCIAGERAKHVLRICSRCNRQYTRCGDGGPCIVNGVRYASHR